MKHQFANPKKHVRQTNSCGKANPKLRGHAYSHFVNQLQPATGNHSMLHSNPDVIKGKLTIGKPSDKYEQEADKVAAQVMHRMNTTNHEAIQQQNLRQSAEAKRLPNIRNMRYSQITPVLRSVVASDTLVAPGLELAIKNEQSRGRALPNGLREQLEQAFGANFNNISIHTDSVSGELNRLLSAYAFTVDNDIFFRNGAFNPGSRSGKELIAHELAHVVQQGESLKETPLIQRRIGIRAVFVDVEDWSSVVWEEELFLTQRQIDTLIRLIENPEGLDLEAFIREGGSDEERTLRGSLLETALREMHASDQDYIFDNYNELGQAVERRAEAPLQRTLEQAALYQYIEDRIRLGSFSPTDWHEIRERARRAGLAFEGLVDMLSNRLDIILDDAQLISNMCLSDNSEMAGFRSIFSTRISISEQGFRSLQTGLLDSFLSQILTDRTISNTEFLALVEIRDATHPDLIEQALERTNLDEDSRSSLHRLIRISESEQPPAPEVESEGHEHQIRVEASLMTFREAGDELQAVDDPTHEALQSFVEETQWEYSTQHRINVLLEGRSSEDIRDLFVGMHIDVESASLLGRFFSSRESNTLEFWRSAQSISFQERESIRQLTGESRLHLENQSLPEFVIPIITLERVYRGIRGSRAQLDNYRFPSGETRSAIQMNLEFRGRTITLIGPADVLSVENFFNRLNTALSAVPLHHVGFLSQLIIDPSRWETVTAETDRNGETVTVYLNRHGADITLDILNAVTIHEFGHLVHMQAARRVDRFWDRWRVAMQQDRIGVSRYGLTNHFEDFAESYVLYTSGGCSTEATRQRYQHRCGILDEINRTVRFE